MKLFEVKQLPDKLPSTLKVLLGYRLINNKQTTVFYDMPVDSDLQTFYQKFLKYHKENKLDNPKNWFKEKLAHKKDLVDDMWYNFDKQRKKERLSKYKYSDIASPQVIATITTTAIFKL